MRYIDFSNLQAPEGWLEEAQVAKDLVENGGKIEAYSSVWRKFKPALEALVGKKCWYCETKQSRSDKEVDHFRPKSRVSGVTPKHDGYTWLAFDFQNYRYSCGYCNKRRKDKGNENKVGGKGNYFPLLDETRRARTPGEEVNEEPILIDPCLQEDVALISYEENGLPKGNDDLDSVQKERVEQSIRYYHLDHSEIVEDRLVLSVSINESLNDADYLFDKVKQGDKVANKMFLNKLKNLRKSLEISEKYSLFAEKYLRNRSKDYDWIGLVYE